MDRNGVDAFKKFIAIFDKALFRANDSLHTFKNNARRLALTLNWICAQGYQTGKYFIKSS